MEVVGRDRAEALEQVAREVGALRELVAVIGEELGQDVPAVDMHCAHPREVVEPDLVDQHSLRLDSEQRCDLPLKPDRDVAEADRAMAGVEQPADDDANRIREVDDPRVACRELPGALRDLENHRDGSERLPEPARAGRLLPDAAARERDRLVGEAGRLSADAQLDQHERCSFERFVEVVRDGQLAVVARCGQHPGRQPADDFAALRVDVMQDELTQVEALSFLREPGHELGRIGRAAADDCELHARDRLEGLTLIL